MCRRRASQATAASSCSQPLHRHRPGVSSHIGDKDGPAYVRGAQHQARIACYSQMPNR
jgi:hypothetical protein